MSGSRDVLPRTGKPFNYPWRTVGDTLVMTKATYIDVPHFLAVDEFPGASSGPRLRVASHSTLTSNLTDLADTRMASVPAVFSYTALSSWLPWMGMGQTPGHVLWAESGRKLAGLDDAPGDLLAALRRVHPAWFQRPEPWPEFTNMFLQWRAAAGASR